MILTGKPKLKTTETKESPEQRSERLKLQAAKKLAKKMSETPYGVVTQQYNMVNGHIALIETTSKETDI